MNMTRGGRYNWKNQSERLVYVGLKGSWHQFEKVGEPGVVWCEVLTADLHMLEKTVPATKQVTAENLVKGMVIIWEDGDELEVVGSSTMPNGRRDILCLNENRRTVWLDDINPTRHFNVKE